MLTRITTRDHARKLAEEHAGRPVDRVTTIEELAEEYTQPPNIFWGPPLSECWIAYLARPTPGPGADVSVIGPSDIVLVDRQTGIVRYSGSANDEG